MEPIAIVGMDVLLPGAGSLEAYWRNLVDGIDAITNTPEVRWDPEHYTPEPSDRVDRVYCQRGGFVDEFAYFDPMPYGVMPTSVPQAEPEQLISLRVASAAIEDAGGLDRLGDRDRIGVILGRGGYSGIAHAKFGSRVHMPGQLKKIIRELLPEVPEERLEQVRVRMDEAFGELHPESVINLVPNLVASRIANRLNLRGPAYTTDGACASSLLAVDQAISVLARGQMDTVLAGGVHHVHDLSFWSIFSLIGGLSRTGMIRPFDARADGLLIGEGTGMVVLRRLSDAIRDRMRIHAVIRGSGISSDGRAASLVNPESGGQAVAIRRAWAAAELDPAAPGALGMLEAHGTATPVGDAVELATIADVFGPLRDGSPAVIGSVKSMIGHTMPSAGIAGLVKAVLAVSRATLLPTLHCETPRPEMARTRFAPIAEARPWNGPGPRRAAANAFGFGGINAHVVIEEAPEPSVPRRRAAGSPPPTAAQVSEPEQVILLSGPSPAAISAALDADDAEIRSRSTDYDAAGGPCRLGIVGPATARLAAARKIAAAGSPWRGGRDIWFSPQPLLADGTGRIAYIFPGLEADFTPRVDDLAGYFGLIGRDTAAQDGHTDVIGCIHVGWMLHEALGRIGISPDILAGHSLGEWTAVMTAGMLDETKLDDYAAAYLESQSGYERHDLHHAVISEGADTVTARLAGYSGVVLALDNAPAQSVVCGPVEQVTRLLDDLARQNVLCRLLPFATGIHTPYMQPLVDQLRELSGAEISAQTQARQARKQVWSATIVGPIPADPVQRQELFFQSMVEPVRFRTTVQRLYDAGVRVFLQVGPGQLASLIDDNLRGLDHLAMPANVAFRSGIDQLRRVATALWAEGYAPDFAALPSPRTAEAGAARTEREAGPRRLAARSKPMRLELGWSLPPLGEDASELLRGHAAVLTHGSADTSLGRLTRLGGHSPASVELAALLDDTANAAVAVLSHGRLSQGNGGTAQAPERARPTPPSPPSAPARRAAAEVPAHTTTLRFSLETMPYLRDHCFYFQPDDWPDHADRWPVVPATTIVQHMMDAVEAVVPGTLAVAASNMRFNHWVIAEPPQNIEITIRPDAAPDQYSVAFGSNARAVIHTAAAYPATPPPAWQHDPAPEWPAPTNVERYYDERYLFHGPSIGGVAAVHGLGERHARGLLRTPPAPGGLLDSALQLLVIWLCETQPRQKISFPLSFGSIRFFGPAPAEGDMVECVARITGLEGTELKYGLQLSRSPDGPVWAVLEDGLNRRYATNDETRLVEAFPGRNAASVRQPEGWVVLFDYWPDPATQLRTVPLMFGGAALAEFTQLPIAQRKSWLMSRIAVNDAARFLLWDDDPREVFPIEVKVTEVGDGRARVPEWPQRRIPAFDASSAFCGGVAVAIARRTDPARGGPAQGIAIVPAADGDPGPAAQAAVEAVARAEGDATAGDRGEITVTGTAAETLIVTVAATARNYRVRYRDLTDPAGRRFTVAWTDGLDDAAPGNITPTRRATI